LVTSSYGSVFLDSNGQARGGYALARCARSADRRLSKKRKGKNLAEVARRRRPKVGIDPDVLRRKVKWTSETLKTMLGHYVGVDSSASLSWKLLEW